MNFSVSARGLCILQDSERQINSYMGHTLYFTLLLISLPLAFELLVCSMKWVGTLIMLNPGNITYHKSRLIHQKSWLISHKGLTLGNFTLKIFSKILRHLFRVYSLRACPRVHQAVVLHAISPISMKLCQFKGSTPKLKKTNWFLFWFFPGGDRPPPGFSWFSPRKSLQNR